MEATDARMRERARAWTHTPDEGKFAKEIPEPAKLLKALNTATDKVEQLYKSGKRKNKRITEGVLKGKQTPMKVVNDAVAHLTTNKLKVPNGTNGGWLLLNFLHGMQSGMDAESILETLVNGEAIEAPPVKKRGRKKKAQASANA